MALSMATLENEVVVQACLGGHASALRYLRFDVDAPIFEGLRPIHLVAAAGRAECVAALADLGANLENVDCELHQNTALHFAVLARKQDAAIALLDAGASIDPKNCVGTTPLHDAARVGDLALVQKLWRRCASWQRPNAYGNTVLHRSALYRRIELLTWIGQAVPPAARQEFFAYRNGHGYTAYDIAVSRGDARIVEALVAMGAAVAGGRDISKPYSERQAWDAFHRARLAS